MGSKEDMEVLTTNEQLFYIAIGFGISAFVALVIWLANILIDNLYWTPEPEPDHELEYHTIVTDDNKVTGLTGRKIQ